MAVVGHPDHGFLAISVFFFAHVFVAAIPAVLLWYPLRIELLSILLFVVVAVLLTPPLLPWYRRLHPQPLSSTE
jgi:prepilin signal peptidase PulO-like enzyme (type II secretory pathway)